MNTKTLLAGIEGGNFDTVLTSLYGADQLDMQRARYAKAVNEFTSEPSKGMTYAIPYCVEAVKKQAENKMKLFGSIKRY